VFNDLGDWIRIAVIAVVILGYAIKIFRDAFARQRPAQSEPPREEALRGEALRGEQLRGEAPGPRPAGGQGGTRDIREFLDEIRKGLQEAQAQDTPPPAAGPPPLPAALQPAPAQASPQRPGGRGERKKRAKPALEAQFVPAPAAQSAHDYLEDLHQVAETADAASRAQKANVPSRRASIPGLNVSLRDALIAGVILGPPRSKSSRSHQRIPGRGRPRRP